MIDAGEAPVVPTTPWVVGVGASAGGLEALQRFFGALRAPTGAAFVVVQHLAPDHRSMMAELLGRQCPLPVATAEPDTPLQADQVYLMPPGVMMTLAANQLAFSPRPAHGVSLPIDLFLGSMSQVSPERAIGVILSGSGGDGTEGVRQLRAAGGFVLVQTPESAKFDSMPRSAIASTTPDAVLPPEELAAQVLTWTRGQSARTSMAVDLLTLPERPALQRLFDRLLQTSGIDFGQYKMATVMRRIERRMVACERSSLTAYAELVADSVSEVEALRRELLIPVTSFFRDAGAWDALRQVLSELIQRQPDGRPLRVWSAGCATGEEAYSLAVTLAELCHSAQRWPGFKVFASDVDAQVLEVASQGSYPAEALDMLDPARREAYFELQDDRAVVRPELRQGLLFARHNLLDDAPFTRMDLVLCRNTLIYLQAAAQDRVLRRLQYALNPEGLLMLGGSEALGGLQPDFQTVDANHKIYRLLRPALTSTVLREGFGRHAPASPRPLRAESAGSASMTVVDRSALMLMSDYVPLSLLINEHRQLLHAWGPTRRWLRMPEGSPGLDAIRLLPPTLGLVTMHAVRTVIQGQAQFRSEPISVDLDDGRVLVRVVGRAVPLGDSADRCVLISVEEIGLLAPVTELSSGIGTSPEEVARLHGLETELAQLRHSHQTSVEELEAANEELQATNEELMSSNEELQSTNEELQSVNEELQTVNAEYNAKLEALGNLNADLEGMSASTGLATVFVDHRLCIVRFTPEATLHFRLRPSDVGRSLEDFQPRIEDPQLMSDLRRALAEGGLIEREVRGPHGNVHLLRVLGYTTPGSQQVRAVLSLIDISRVRDAQRLQHILDSLPEHVAVLDAHGTIVQVNRSWETFAQGNDAALQGSTGVGVNYFAVLAKASNADALDILARMQQVLSGEREAYSLNYPCHSPTARRWFVMHVRRLGGDPAGLVVTHFDVTPWMDQAGGEVVHG